MNLETSLHKGFQGLSIKCVIFLLTTPFFCCYKGNNIFGNHENLVFDYPSRHLPAKSLQ